MFQIGELIIHGTNGVCEVAEITKLSMPGADNDRMYYVLRPYYQKGGKIFSPVDSDKVLMRKVITKDEVEQLLEEMPTIGTLWVENERLRENQYKECVRTGDCRELVKIIKTLYTRKMDRMAQGKQVTSTDEQYLKIAEDSLYSEMAIALGIPRDKVKEYIISYLKKWDEEQEKLKDK